MSNVYVTIMKSPLFITVQQKAIIITPLQNHHILAITFPFLNSSIPTRVPTAAVKFLHEVLYQPDWVLRDKFPNLVRSTTYDFGGHFAALHTPQVFAEDIFDATVAFLKFHDKK